MSSLMIFSSEMDSSHSFMNLLNDSASSLDAMLIRFREANLSLMVFADALKAMIKSGGGSRLRVNV
jgi:hypothetical protein